MIIEPLLCIVLVTQIGTVFFLVRITTLLNEVVFNQNFNRDDFIKDYGWTHWEIPHIMNSYEEQINDLKKEVKSLKKSNKTLQKNNQKLTKENDCLKQRCEDLSDDLYNFQNRKGVMGRGVIYE